MINLKISSKIFNSLYLKNLIYNKKSRQIVFGGSSSGKSFALAQRCVIDIITTDRNYLIVRHTLNSLRKSTWNELQKTISNFKLTHLFHINKSEMIITCILNNQQIIFCGLDDPEKIKSITPIKGVLTDVWIEEATQTSRDSYKQLEKRLRGNSIANKRITLSFNPILKTHWIFQEFFQKWRDDSNIYEDENLFILKSTYKNNEFLTQDDVNKLENETDKYYHDVYVLGNWGILGALIFKNYEVRDFDYNSFDKIRNGIDWGFSVDPFAFVRCHIDKKKKELYIFDEIYAIDLSNEEVSELIKNKIRKDEIVTCDSSEPKSIVELNKLGIRAKKAKKGQGSVEFGIKSLQSYKIYIHSNCPNTKHEFETYKYKETVNGETLPVPLDKNNHIIDALRYALENDFLENKFGTFKNNLF